MAIFWPITALLCFIWSSLCAGNSCFILWIYLRTCLFGINILWYWQFKELLRQLLICLAKKEKHRNLKWFWELSRLKTSHSFIISGKHWSQSFNSKYKNQDETETVLEIIAFITWRLFEHQIKWKNCWAKYFPIFRFYWLSVFLRNIKLLFHWRIIGKSLRSSGGKIN